MEDKILSEPSLTHALTPYLDRNPPPVNVVPFHVQGRLIVVPSRDWRSKRVSSHKEYCLKKVSSLHKHMD